MDEEDNLPLFICTYCFNCNRYDDDDANENLIFLFLMKFFDCIIVIIDAVNFMALPQTIVH